MRNTLLLLFILFFTQTSAQESLKGLLTDAITGQALPFATIKYGNTGQGSIADLNGKFEISLSSNVTYIVFSYLGYESKKLNIQATMPFLKIALKPQEDILSEVVIKPPYQKVKRILNEAIAHTDENNPDKYDWYRCHVYYKMIADIVPDSALAKDTSENTRLLKSFSINQHLIMSETYSIRTWQRPEHLQEEVVASRFSGLKKSMFTSLVTDVLPFHSYNDYINLNGKDYHNPVSKGYAQRYEFNLVDEMMQGKDTVWILSFCPKKDANELRGTVYINSNKYAIAYLIAKSHDSDLKRSVGLEQQYQYLDLPGSNEGRWFPSQLNYFIEMEHKSDKNTYYIHMNGNSVIDSVSWKEDPHFRFDKVHTVKISPDADEQNDTAWRNLRPVALDRKEARTYKFDDSLMEKVHGEKIVSLLSKLPQGKLPLGIFDINLNHIIRFNEYENIRLGLGLQTNEKLVKWLSLGGWFGYGFSDAAWKYGVFAETYLDPYKEFVIKVAYDNDIIDPGRILLNRELDKTGISMYLLDRVDSVASYSASIKKRFGYWTAELGGRQEYISAKYGYQFDYNGLLNSRFKAKEISLNLRYAYGEHTAPVFGYYQSLGSKYPVWYSRITRGNIESKDASYQTSYTQAVSAVVYHKHINRLGMENFMLEGGKVWSDKSLPLAKLFAGNGFLYNSNGFVFQNVGLYAFNGMMTFYPYDYYMDQFANFIFRHDFDWKLYTIKTKDAKFSSAPSLSVQYSMLYGTLANRQAQLINISVPDNAYHEAGIMLNNLFRINDHFYYSGLNIGYFYHIASAFDLSKNGHFVIGAGIEL